MTHQRPGRFLTMRQRRGTAIVDMPGTATSPVASADDGRSFTIELTWFPSLNIAGASDRHMVHHRQWDWKSYWFHRDRCQCTDATAETIVYVPLTLLGDTSRNATGRLIMAFSAVIFSRTRVMRFATELQASLRNH